MVLDKIEQGLDMVTEAAAAADLKLGTDFFLGVDCGGDDMWEPAKNKYELVGGQLKHAADLVRGVGVTILRCC